MPPPRPRSRPRQQHRPRQRHQPRQRPGRRYRHRPALAGGAGGADHLIEHDTGHDHDQGSSTGPPPLVKLPETITRQTDQEPPHRARHRPRHRPRSRPMQQHRPALAGEAVGAGHRIEHGTGHGNDRNQGDDTGPPLLMELVELTTSSSTTPAMAPATITT
jgi:hypothetical protein